MYISVMTGVINRLAVWLKFCIILTNNRDYINSYIYAATLQHNIDDFMRPSQYAGFPRGFLTKFPFDLT